MAQKMVQKIEDKLDQAWSFKIYQQDLLFLNVWSDIVELTGITLDHQPELFLSQQCAHFAPEVRIYLATLFAYHLRQHDEKEKARIWLLAAKRYVPMAKPCFALYAFYLEQGTQYLHVGNFSQAYEAYLQSLLFATSPHQLALALINQLLCEENLGLESQTAYHKIQNILEALPPGSHSVYQQLKAYEERELFRAAKFEKLFSMEKPQKPGQEQYYKAWVSELPYVNSSTQTLYYKKIKDLDQFPTVSLRPFLRRTLLVTYLPEDLNDNMLIHMVDRIYLWLWKFIASPTPSLAHHLLVMLNTLKFPEDLRRFTCEDQLMLRNVLLWLSVLNPDQSPRLALLINQIPQPHLGFAPLLEFEFKLAQLCLRQVKRTASITTQNQNAAIETIEGAELRAELTQLPELTKMHDMAMSLIQKKSRPECDKNKIYVDIRFERVCKNNVSVVSSELASALYLLASSETLSVERFAKTCFRLSEYRAESHKRRVFLLFKRVKEILGQGAFIKICSEMILRSGFGNVQVLIPELDHDVLFKEDLWPVFLNQIRFESTNEFSDVENKILSHLKGEARTQKELSQALGLSKTTLLRRLKDLMGKNCIQAEGSGRSIRYVVNNSKNDLNLNREQRSSEPLP